MMANHLLSVPMEENDAGADTIGEYLSLLLCLLIEEQESFSGKRPFGNSGWIYELLTPLVRHGVVSGEVDDHGELITANKDEFYTRLTEAIDRALNV